jgi:hypothetical protein
MEFLGLGFLLRYQVLNLLFFSFYDGNIVTIMLIFFFLCSLFSLSRYLDMCIDGCTYALCFGCLELIYLMMIQKMTALHLIPHNLFKGLYPRPILVGIDTRRQLSIPTSDSAKIGNLCTKFVQRIN